MSAHLGDRVSALLDAQLSAEETERAWAHVHLCHSCRDQVEREGWIKTRLARSSFDSGPAPEALKGALLGMPPGDAFMSFADEPVHQRVRPKRVAGFAAIGGGAVGAAVMGVLALGTAPADAPSIDRRAPVTQVTTSVPTVVTSPTREHR